MSYHDINTMNIERLLYLFEKRMRVLLQQESKRHMMDALPSWVIDKIEEEIMPALEYINDWEPSDDEIYNYGEPAMTMDEMHTASWKQHQEAHS